jgi:hypothetical protein
LAAVKEPVIFVAERAQRRRYPKSSLRFRRFAACRNFRLNHFHPSFASLKMRAAATRIAPPLNYEPFY